MATGNFRTIFPIANLNGFLNDGAAKFGKGTVIANLRYQGDVMNYRISKPAVAGTIRSIALTTCDSGTSSVKAAT